MRKIRTALTAGVLAAAIAGGTYAFFGSPLVPTAQARWHDHPRLEGAYHSLKDAKEYLEAASHDFHGHRAEAVDAIKAAMHQVALCAEEEGTPGTSIAPDPFADHPKLHEARDHLKEARAYLHDAPHDFHGHREEAIKAIDAAIHQINRCLEE